MTRQQDWARRAHKLVHNRAKGTKDERAKYKTHCMKLPTLLQQSGLIQALVFLRTRENPGPAFCDEIAVVYGRSELSDGAALVSRAENAPLPEYLALSRDIADVSVWFRRFAQIELADVPEVDH